jgi:hypothetical protein
MLELGKLVTDEARSDDMDGSDTNVGKMVTKLNSPTKATMEDAANMYRQRP